MHVVHLLVNDMVILWIPILLLGLLTLRRHKSPAILRLSIIVVTILATIFGSHVVLRVISIHTMRYFIIVMPFFCMVVAHLLFVLPRQKVVLALFIVLWIAGGIQIWQQAERWTYAGHQTLLMDHPPLQRFADALHGLAREEDYMLGFAASPAINWRLKHGYSKGDYYTQIALGIDGAFVNARLSGEDLMKDIERRFDHNPYLLFTFDPREESVVFDQVFAALQREYKPCAMLVNQDDVFIQRYVYRTLTCDRAYQPIRYDNGITIVDKFADYDAENKSVRVVTGWEVADEAQLEQFNVSIQIITSDWQNVRQPGDRHLYDDILKWYVVETSTDGLPPGDYRAVVILYDRYSGGKVNGVDETTGEAGTILPILFFSVKE